MKEMQQKYTFPLHEVNGKQKLSFTLKLFELIFESAFLQPRAVTAAAAGT